MGLFVFLFVSSHFRARDCVRMCARERPRLLARARVCACVRACVRACVVLAWSSCALRYEYIHITH